MQRMKLKVNTIQISFNEITVTDPKVMHGYLLFIKPDDVEWFGVDQNGYSVQKSIKVGSIIEFDRDTLHESTRCLKNVKIL